MKLHKQACDTKILDTLLKLTWSPKAQYAFQQKRKARYAAAITYRIELN